MRKKYVILLLCCILIGSMTLTACKKKNNDKDVDSVEVIVVPTITPTSPIEETPDDNDTDAGTVTEIPEQTISDSDAIKLIQDKIGERGYYIELLDDHLNIGDYTYYTFQISDSTTNIEPVVIVNNKTGEILCYYTDGTTAPFSEFPLFTKTDDSTTTNDKGEFKKEDALNLLTKVPAETLGLPSPIAEYTIMYDDWTTLINGIDCYGINVYSETEDKMINMGLFYVAVDGSKMYKFDVMEDDFVEIKAE
jgi:hypothetical protein